MKKFLFPLLVLALMLGGCQSAAMSDGAYTGQGLTATYTRPSVPGVVVSTHADGSTTVVPLVVGETPAPVAKPTATSSPVVQVTVIAPQPGMSASYRVTPEKQEGDKIASSRVMTWAGEAPGTVVEKVSTQKQKATHNPLPAVTLDDKGIHAAAGGGSTEDQAGMSWYQRAVVWVSDFFKGISMWLLVIGIGLVVIFVLPLIIPALAPIMARLWGAIRTVLGWAWDVVERIIAWFETKMKKTTPAVTVVPTPPAVVTPAETTTTTTTQVTDVPAAKV